MTPKIINSLVDVYKRQISHFGSPNPDYVLAMNKLKGDDIISFTSKYNELIEIQNQRKAMNLAQQQSEQQNINQVRCPKCGSTQITTGQMCIRDSPISPLLDTIKASPPLFISSVVE